jgi:hypothetical protein
MEAEDDIEIEDRKLEDREKENERSPEYWS